MADAQRQAMMVTGAMTLNRTPEGFAIGAGYAKEVTDKTPDEVISKNEETN